MSFVQGDRNDDNDMVPSTDYVARIRGTRLMLWYNKKL
jgi:hypothetical protein